MIAQLDLGEHTNEILEQRLISGQQINMKTTDTPRTDAYNNSLGVVPSDFARQLERELSELWSRFDKQMEAEAEVESLREENAALKKNKVFVDPKWIYDLETQLAKAHEELCQAGLRDYGN